MSNSARHSTIGRRLSLRGAHRQIHRSIMAFGICYGPDTLYTVNNIGRIRLFVVVVASHRPQYQGAGWGLDRVACSSVRRLSMSTCEARRGGESRWLSAHAGCCTLQDSRGTSRKSSLVSSRQAGHATETGHSSWRLATGRQPEAGQRAETAGKK